MDILQLSKGKNQFDYKDLFKKTVELKDEFFSNSPPQIFIGSKLKPPFVNVGILSPPSRTEDSWLYSAEKFWAENNFSIQDVLKLRGNLINSRFKAKVLDARNSTKFLEISQQIGMSISPVDVEIELQKKIRIGLDLDSVSAPMGPRAPLKKITLTENPKIPMKIDKVVDDIDLKASSALEYLYKNHFDNQALTQLLSLGVLGLKKNRKLVPTRFSITATDDILGKQIMSKLRDFNSISDYQLYFGNFLGNYYLIMLFPDVLSYELFEIYLPGSAWNNSEELKVSTDYENYYGRKDYASNCVGGYYSSRISVMEKLMEKRRQASVLVLRFETPSYWAGLGVWVVREAAKKSISSIPLKFASREEMLKEARNLIFKQLNFDINTI